MQDPGSQIANPTRRTSCIVTSWDYFDLNERHAAFLDEYNDRHRPLLIYFISSYKTCSEDIGSATSNRAQSCAPVILDPESNILVRRNLLSDSYARKLPPSRALRMSYHTLA